MLRQTEIDGVPTLIAPTSGPMTAGLTFRVGSSDERLTTAGITHMVEHLALYQQGVAEYHYNGASSSIYTTFQVRGTEADIVRYLTGVCDSLARMPMHRLETEKEILRTEARGRGSSDMPMWRYGAQGYGLSSYPEWGLSRLQPNDVEYWARTWFTRQNAVLWIAGSDIPAGLSLNLRDGSRMPLSAPTSALPVTPAYFTGDPGKVVLDMLLPAGVTAQVLAVVLERELFRSLRQEGGYSYTAAADYESRGDGAALLTAVADALPQKQDAAIGAFIDVLAKLRAGRIDQGDINFALTKAQESLTHPNIHAARLPGKAMSLLTGQPSHSGEELLEKLRAVTAGDIWHAVHEGLRTALLQVPHGHDAEWAGFAPAPTRSDSLVSGQNYRGLGRNTIHLLTAADGVSVKVDSSQVTVRYQQCAAVLAWPDGARRIVGNDGFVVHLEPTLYANGSKAVGEIDAAAPPALVVWQPARSPQSVPQPDYTKAKRPQSRNRRLKIETLLTGLVAALFLVGFVTTTDRLMMLFLLLCAIGLGRMFWLALKLRARESG